MTAISVIRPADLVNHRLLSPSAVMTGALTYALSRHDRPPCVIWGPVISLSTRGDRGPARWPVMTRLASVIDPGSERIDFVLNSHQAQPLRWSRRSGGTSVPRLQHLGEPLWRPLTLTHEA